MSSSKLKQRLESAGIFCFSLFLRLFGRRGASLFLYPTIFAYTVFGRKIAQNTKSYFKHRFPGQGRLAYFIHRYKTLLSFSLVLLDSYWMGKSKKATLHNEWLNIDALMDICKNGQGAVLLTAHVGNWQTSLNVLDSLPVKMHLMVQANQIEIKKYYGAERDGCPFEIIDTGDPFGGMVSATTALMKGDVVTIMGDRYLGGNYTMADFLGEQVKFPTAAYMLAASVGVPVVIFFTARTSFDTFEVKVWDVLYPEYEKREERQEMLDRYGQDFSRILEKYLKIFPYQWYNFYDSWKQ